MTVNFIKNLAREFDIRPTSQKGQNFLVDEDVLARIIERADIRRADKVLEIGPGFGILTKQLLDKGAVVLAVEMDKKLANHMRETFSEYKNLQILEKDILKVSNQEIYDALHGEFRVVSNIPYQITGKIIKKFLSSDLPKPKDAVLLVQKEVAERVCAKAGDMSLLALSVQLYSDPKICFDVSKDAFWPVPKVDSSLLRMQNISEKPRYDVDESRFWQVARIGFSSPRKQLRNNLANGLPAKGWPSSGWQINQADVKLALHEAGLSETARAQELDVKDWIKLIHTLD
ncbi:ribosomal RNA small subunit methyltransferase A [Patescibacteria group bacterium]|nr:ribosomal RNA small subunit methyltransferase A [Patescibacteria group bacterium]